MLHWNILPVRGTEHGCICAVGNETVLDGVYDFNHLLKHHCIFDVIRLAFKKEVTRLCGKISVNYSCKVALSFFKRTFLPMLI